MDWLSYNGHCYYMGQHTATATMDEAWDYCMAHNSLLLSINDEAEAEFTRIAINSQFTSPVCLCLPPCFFPFSLLLCLSASLSVSLSLSLCVSVFLADYAQQFTESMHSDITKEQLSLASSLIDVDINEALISFNDCLKQNAECMKRKIYVNRPKKMDEWYDEECRAARKNVRKLLRKFRKSLDRLVCKDYCCARREYKKIVATKEKEV